MKKKSKFKYVVFIIIIVVVIIFYNRQNSQIQETSQEVSETEVVKTDILNTLYSSSYITSELEEQKQLHATYYFEEIYFEQNQKISSGENILKYTNGEYLVAPYDCVITSLSLPNSGEVCKNNHYITIQSTDTLEITLQIEEDELDKIYIGQEAKIQLIALKDKILTGYVTNISNTANYSSSGSTFQVKVGFSNDGEILLRNVSKM